MKINLSKKKYIISAGADGLGFAIANKIINSGGKVYLSDINKSKIDKINLNKKYRNKIFAKHLDCTNPKDIKEYFKSLSNLKKIDGLINNIGIAGPTKYLQNISIDEWDNTIKTNLSSHFYYTKFAIPFLKKTKREYKFMHKILTRSLVSSLVFCQLLSLFSNLKKNKIDKIFSSIF